MTEEQQGGTEPQAEASAAAAEPATVESVAAVAVADEPATIEVEASPTGAASPETQEPEASIAVSPISDEVAPAAEAVAEAPEAAEPAAEAVAEADEVAEPAAEAIEPAAVAESATADVAESTDAVDEVLAEEVAEVAADDAIAELATEVEDAPAAAVEADAEPEVVAKAPLGPEPTTMEELLAEQDSDIRSFKHGDVVEGNVVRIDKDEILVDIGAKSEGVVSNRELFGRNTESQPALSIGDTVLVYVLQPESPEGHAVLSLRRAGLERKWRSMQEQFEAGVIIEAPVIDHNKGGLIVDCGIRGFVPISQIVDFPRRPQNDQPRDAAQEIAEKLQPYVGRKLRLKILEVNRKANRLILSEKVALYEERREKRDELFSSLQVGQQVKGTVRSIAPFGVFIDLGGIDGLVHKSELSWNKVNNPEAGYKVGEEVEAEVIDINHERGRISLSIRRLQPDPWHSTVADFKVGDIIDGTVTKLVNFGAFVRVRDGLEGLIHISELSHQRVAHPGDVVHEGQQLKLKIISLDSERHRLGLSLKQAEEPPARPAPEPGATPAAATGTSPRPERRDRRERGERAWSASDAVQEPEGGIDNTLASAFAQVRQQLAEAEAADDGAVGAEVVAEQAVADAASFGEQAEDAVADALVADAIADEVVDEAVAAEVVAEETVVEASIAEAVAEEAIVEADETEAIAEESVDAAAALAGGPDEELAEEIAEEAVAEAAAADAVAEEAVVEAIVAEEIAEEAVAEAVETETIAEIVVADAEEAEAEAVEAVSEAADAEEDAEAAVVAEAEAESDAGAATLEALDSVVALEEAEEAEEAEAKVSS